MTTTRTPAKKAAASRPKSEPVDRGPGPDDAVNHVLIEGDPPVDDEETDQ